MSDLHQIYHYAWTDLVELMPYFVLAILIGASVNVLSLDVLARRSFRKHGLLGILFTTGLGAFSPFCSFTVIPLIRKLLRGGVPLSAVMAFWIASPAMDPPIFALTAKQLGLPIATARLTGAVVLSVGTGLAILVLERRGMFADVLRPEPAPRRTRRQRAAVPVQVPAVPVPVPVGAGVAAESVVLVPAPPLDVPAESAGGLGAQVLVESAGCGAATEPAAGGCAAAASSCGSADDVDDGRPWWPLAKDNLRTHDWAKTVRGIGSDMVSLGKWLVFAVLFMAIIRMYVPEKLVTDTLGGAGLVAIPLGVLLSVPLYLNGIGAIPIVGALLAKGMMPGAAVSFLLGGAVTTIPAMVAVRSVVNNRVFAIYLGAGMMGSMILGFIAQPFL